VRQQCRHPRRTPLGLRLRLPGMSRALQSPRPALISSNPEKLILSAHSCPVQCEDLDWQTVVASRRNRSLSETPEPRDPIDPRD
jgi:hypothetical protein